MAVSSFADLVQAKAVESGDLLSDDLALFQLHEGLYACSQGCTSRGGCTGPSKGGENGGRTLAHTCRLRRRAIQWQPKRIRRTDSLALRPHNGHRPGRRQTNSRGRHQRCGVALPPSIAGPTDYEILIPEPDTPGFANLHGDALWLPFGRAGRPSKGGKPWIKSQLPHFPLTATPARRPPDRSARAQRSGRGNGAARGMDERSLSLSTGTSVERLYSWLLPGLSRTELDLCSIVSARRRRSGECAPGDVRRRVLFQRRDLVDDRLWANVAGDLLTIYPWNHGGKRKQAIETARICVTSGGYRRCPQRALAHRAH